MILYKLNNSNQISWWKIEQDGCNYHISWGQNVATMNQQTANHNSYVTPTPERALFEMESRINEQKDRRGYTEHKPKTVPDLPMLAQQWTDHVSKVESGKRQPFQSIMIQPKIDGIRCIATPTSMQSRRAEPITSCPHILEALSHLPPDIKLDGELFIPNVDLQTVQSYTRRQRPHKLYKYIEYHIFDIVDTEMPFIERYTRLSELIPTLDVTIKTLWNDFSEIPEKLRGKSHLTPTNPIKLVPTLHVKHPCNTTISKGQIAFCFKAFIESNYEGCIIRNPESPYELNYRSPNLLKYKERKDTEFEVIDISEGYDSTGIFVCKTAEGKIFEATPAWTRDRKKWLLQTKEKHIGKFVTVEFETYSQDGIPLKPTAKCFRQVPLSKPEPTPDPEPLPTTLWGQKL